MEHEEGSALLGTLRLSVRENNSSLANSSEAAASCSLLRPYAPSLALIPELHSCSIPLSVPASRDNIAERIDLSISSWDVQAFNAFFRGAGAADNSTKKAAAATSAPARRTAREVLNQMIVCGRLPGFTASSSLSGDATKASAAAACVGVSHHQQQLPTLEQVLEDLAKFASQIGATDEDAAALKTQHFLHFLGHQRLEQLMGTLRFSGLCSSSSSSSSSHGVSSAAVVVPTSLFSMKLPQSMVPQQQSKSSDKGTATAVAHKNAELFDAMIKLLGLDNDNDENNKNNAGASSSSSSSTSSAAAAVAFWAPPPQQISTATQTIVPRNLLGTVNLSITAADAATTAGDANQKNENKSAAVDAAAAHGELHPAERNVSVTLPVSCLKAAKPWSVRIRRLKREEDETATSGDTAAIEEGNNSNINGARVIELSFSSPQVVFGRISSSSGSNAALVPRIGVIRSRPDEAGDNDDEDEEKNNTAIVQANMKYFAPDPFHVDLAAIVRYLSNGEDSGKHVSREHFTLSLPSSGPGMTLLPLSLNMTRVDGAVVYSEPRALVSGSKIVVGSGQRGAREVEVEVTF